MNQSSQTISGSMREVLRIAFPLIVASSGHVIRLLADRIMLARYSHDAIAASMPAGLSCFVLMSLFMGTAGYVNTFVAQYAGANRSKRVGVAVWQALFIALAGGLVVALCAQAAGPLFAWMGHGPAIRVQQERYFRVLCRLSAAPIMLGTVLAFWSGRGRTRVVMALELFAATLNVVINYLLIFGHAGFPELGVTGAAIGTGVSSLISLVIALSLFLSPHNRRTYGTLPHHAFNAPLMGRLLRFGLPNGILFMLELAAFNLFVVFVGRMGSIELEAANMAFAINATAFMPAIGLGMTASILVAQAVGAGRIPAARRAVRSACLLAVLYMAALGVLFLGVPEVILSVFARADDLAQRETLAMAGICLRYITAYLLFDAMYIIYSHAIKGAGDTRFSMWMGLALSWGVLVVPSYMALRSGASVWTLWTILVAHVMLAGVVFYARYRGGKWQTMQVIEDSIVPGEPPGRTVGIELDRG